jgi:cytidine deaminase
MTKFDEQKLLEAAREAAKHSYAPYSKEPKGAALLCSDGSLYTSGNVEFATFGGTICAEAGALARAVSDGKQEFRAVALYPYRFPCGNCRQFLNEFGLDVEVITAREDGAVERRALPELLPHSFGKSNLA